MIRELIERYIADSDLPARSIAGLSREQLLAHPIQGTWSIQEVILHVMDSDLVASDRMKRVIAGPNPTLLAYDENNYIARLGYDRLDAKLACEIFRLNRLMTGAILRNLPDSDFARVGQHTERGDESLRQIVQIYVDHLHHHFKFLRAKRVALGLPAGD